MCVFPLVCYCNYMPIVYRFRDIIVAVAVEYLRFFAVLPTLRLRFS